MREHPALQKINFINSFLFFWAIFALLDPDPDPGTPMIPGLDPRQWFSPHIYKNLNSCTPIICIKNFQNSRIGTFNKTRIRIELNVRICIRKRSFRIHNTALKATSGPPTVPVSDSWRLRSAAGEEDRSVEAVTSSDTFNKASEGRVPVVFRRAWVVAAGGRLGTDCSGLECVAGFSQLKQTYTYYD